MAFSIRPTATLTTCLRTTTTTTPTIRHAHQQIRTKTKLATPTTSTIHVRLLKNVPTFGRKGTIVPISAGQMRNNWFPSSTAEYIPPPALKALKATDTPMARDFNFGIDRTPVSLKLTPGGTPVTPELQDASMFQKRPSTVDALTPERSLQLLEIFVPKHMDFFRQPIIEEKPVTPAPKPSSPKEQQRHTLGGAAADLLAARSGPAPLPSAPADGPQAIYGSVSTQDVLVAIRAAMAINDEAARVVLAETDVSFVGLTGAEAAEMSRVKHVGEFKVEVVVKGVLEPVKRTVRVIAQDV